MTVLIVIAGLTFATYLYQPLWFDTRPHYYNKTYQSEKACDHASIHLDKTTGRVCVPKNDHSGHVDLYITKKEKNDKN